MAKTKEAPGIVSIWTFGACLGAFTGAFVGYVLIYMTPQIPDIGAVPTTLASAGFGAWFFGTMMAVSDKALDD